MSLKKKLTLSIVSLGVAAVASTGAFAHGGNGDGHYAFGHPGLAKDVKRTFSITASDYEFSPTALTINAGETVKFVVRNDSKHMHELTVGDEATQTAHRKSMARMTDMQHTEGEHEMPSNAVHVKPGGTGELIWTFTSASELLYVCNYPGHADLGMEGKITVQ